MTPLVGQNTAFITRKPSRDEIWARAVKSRDGKCAHCGSLEDLHAHHIKPRSTHPDLKYEISNGVTLCYRCHKREHERNRVRVRNNKPQRRTLFKRIAVLEARNEFLEAEVERLSGRIAELQTWTPPIHLFSQWVDHITPR